MSQLQESYDFFPPVFIKREHAFSPYDCEENLKNVNAKDCKTRKKKNPIFYYS